MQKLELRINAKPSFTEVWYEGSVTFEGKEYKFWLIDPQGTDEFDREYECDVRWFFKQVPMEVRRMTNEIIQAYKLMKNKSLLN